MKETNKILSIVIPTYNVEKYLARCLDSILFNKEILKDLEIIIVNDGSKDSSLEIAKEYENKYKDVIKVIDKENGGHGSTINVGLKEATGKYFRVLDSDDWFNIDDFPEFVKKLKSIDADMIITNYSREDIVSGESTKVDYESFLEYDKLYNLKNDDLDILEEQYFGMANITYKTEKIIESKLFLDEKTFYVDMLYILIPLPFIDSLIYLDLDIYRYFLGRADQSVNKNSYVKNRKDHDKVLKRLLKFYNTIEDVNIKKYVFKILYFLLETHYLIYCTFPGKEYKKEMKEEIREFDKFLKEINLMLYQRTNKGYIKANRKTNFSFIQNLNNLFSKIATKLFKYDQNKKYYILNE